MAVEAHPAPETLAAFARGDLPATELSAVAEHVSGCEACVASLEGLPDDSLAALARASARPDEPAPTALASMPALPDGLPEGLIDHPRYRVIGELGAGGMGVVYKAEDQFMGRTVALKVMTPSLTAKASAVERFRKEVRAAAQLNHPNIVIAHDTGEAGGRHFLVMEFVEGASLDRVVTRKGPLPIPMAAHFTRQAAQGLQHASEKGMVHRDIKPQNLMVNKRGHIKIMDFGLARFASADEEPAPSGRVPFGAAKMVVDATTNPHLLLGTPDYLSPEQARNSHDVDTRSDVYSLGCTLYFLLTGHAPFAKAESLIDKLLAHTEQQAQPVRGLRPEVPEGLAAVLAKMMSKKPRDRYATPGDAAAALSPFSKGTGSSGNVGDAPVAIAEPAGFEVVDAVVIAPSHSGTPRPAKNPTAAAFAFDTPADPQGATLVEPTRVRKAKRSKKLVPWWKRKGTLIGAAIAACALLVGGIIAATGKKKDETPPDNGGSAKLAPGTDSSQPKGKSKDAGTGGKAKDLKVLYVVPSEGVYGPDYFPVKSKLEQKVKVVTASGQGMPATVYGDVGKTIPVDLKLADADANDFVAIVFCGFKTDEYVQLPDAVAVKYLIEKMQSQKKLVTAICLGERVLITHGALKGKSAARSSALGREFPGLANEPSIQFESKGVMESGNVITAGGPENSAEFAEAILKALKVD